MNILVKIEYHEHPNLVDRYLKTIFVELQVVRHFWERNDTKGAISAMRKLPDHSVGILSLGSYFVLLIFFPRVRE